MRLFQWLCASEIPPDWDLRRCGWQLSESAVSPAEPGTVALAHRAGMDRHAWSRLRLSYPKRCHGRVLLLGFPDSAERARLLHLGFGDVLDETPTLKEVAARASRIATQAEMLPAHRDFGPLRLDLLARDGFVGGRPLALHPREFALLWRLADKPGRSVTKQALLTDVWRLCHVPETNSVAVHVFRLRAKLAAGGLDGLVQTTPDGSYMLAVPETSAIPLQTNDLHIDDLIVRVGGRLGDIRHDP